MVDFAYATGSNECQLDRVLEKRGKYNGEFTEGKKARRISIRVKWMLFICASIFLAIGVSVSIMDFQITKVFRDDSVTVNKSSQPKMLCHRLTQI